MTSPLATVIAVRYPRYRAGTRYCRTAAQADFFAAGFSGAVFFTADDARFAAQRRLIASASRLRTSGVKRDFRGAAFFETAADFGLAETARSAAFLAAQRFRCAAAIRALPSALMVDLRADSFVDDFSADLRRFFLAGGVATASNGDESPPAPGAGFLPSCRLILSIWASSSALRCSRRLSAYAKMERSSVE